MSASREKKGRQVLYEAGDMTRSTPYVEKKTPIWVKILVTLGAVIAVLAFAAVIFFNSGYLEKNGTAAVVGEHKVSPALYSIFYSDSLYTIQQNYGQYWSYMVSDSTPYDEQVQDSDTGATWADYFKNYTNDAIGQIYAICDDAAANGFTLTADMEQQVDDAIASLSSSAKTNGYSSVDKYLASYYGKGCDTKVYGEYMRMQYLASNYVSEIQSGFSHTDDEIEQYYQENRKNLDMVNFRVYEFDGTAVTDDNATPSEDAVATASADAQAKGEAMAAATKGDEAAFLKQSYLDYYDTDAATDAEVAASDIGTTTLQDNYTYAYCTSVGGTDSAEWLFDESRRAGDTTCIMYNNYACVLYYLGYENNDYSMASIRQILFTPETTAEGDTDAAAAALETAHQAAEAVLAAYKSGDKTEDSFAALANENTADTSTNTTGGLYEKLYKGSTIDGVNNWAFDASRKIGDVGIVQSEYGYHILYYVGTGDNYRHYLGNTALLNQDYSDWESGVTEGYETVPSEFGMRYTTLVNTNA
ncbi:MAG: peptidylprolyl isomerase [Oscillospiraceae bacterium]|nr:peptidylprolyl isomerase [Oscillospiraceae bacterium]